MYGGAVPAPGPGPAPVAPAPGPTATPAVTDAVAVLKQLINDVANPTKMLQATPATPPQ